MSRPATPPICELNDAREPFILQHDIDLADLTGKMCGHAMSHLYDQPPLKCNQVGDRKIGNLLLSSCPGKKIRLDSRGSNRAPVDRDLKTDLMRMRDDAGVQLIVCCVGERELEYLQGTGGWDNYRRCAAEVGIELIRLPMIEGDSPQSPRQLDDLLALIIRDYTLHGRNVLIHCRGGVGRAGLVAAGWLLKCGLIGSGHVSSRFQDNPVHLLSAIDTDPFGLLRIVERCIETVRRRRSPKAIETPTQVAFLIEYANYLRNNGELTSAFDLL